MFIHKKCPPFSDFFPLAHLMDTLLPYSINGNMIYVSSLFESLNRLPIIYNDKKSRETWILQREISVKHTSDSKKVYSGRLETELL